MPPRNVLAVPPPHAVAPEQAKEDGAPAEEPAKPPAISIPVLI